jgi:hypothetical protein
MCTDVQWILSLGAYLYPGTITDNLRTGTQVLEYSSTS